MCSKISNYFFYTILCHILRIYRCDLDIFISNRTADEVYCAPPYQHKHFTKQVVIFIADNNYNNKFLEDCLLVKRSIGHSVVLLNGNGSLHAISKEKKMKYANVGPIMVVVYHSLDTEIIYHPTTKSIFKSHVSSLYITITTTDTKYRCDKGVFSDYVFKTIDLFLNRIWHEYKIFIVIVEFPFVCPEYYVIYKGKKPSENELYDRTITTISTNTPELTKKLIEYGLFNLTTDYPIKANIFQRFPTSITECQNMHYYLKVDEKYTNRMCGMDAFVMHDVLRHYQFNTTFPETTDKDFYGFQYNNTVTGSLGRLLRNEFDISFNSRFMVQYLDEDKINFLHYVSFDAICALMKNPDFLPLWYYTYNFLRLSTWVVFLCLLALCSATNKIFERIRRYMGKETSSSNVIDLISIGVFGCYYNKRIKASILGGVCLIISLILYALFQGHVNYVYTTLVRYSRIKTLNMLRNSDIKVYTPTSFYKMLGTDVQLEVILHSNTSTGDVLTNSNIAILQRKFDVTLEIRRYFSDEEGKPLMYLVQECYCNYYLSYITKKDFPFTNAIKVYLMRLLESGLPDAYYRFTQNALGLATTKDFYTQTSAPRPFIPSNLPEFRIAFSLLCVGYIVSTIALVIERWWVGSLLIK